MRKAVAVLVRVATFPLAVLAVIFIVITAGLYVGLVGLWDGLDRWCK